MTSQLISTALDDMLVSDIATLVPESQERLMRRYFDMKRGWGVSIGQDRAAQYGGLEPFTPADAVILVSQKEPGAISVAGKEPSPLFPPDMDEGQLTVRAQRAGVSFGGETHPHISFAEQRTADDNARRLLFGLGMVVASLVMAITAFLVARFG